MSERKIDRTSTGLREALFDELDALRSGNSSTSKARAVSALASQIATITKLEMDYQRFIQSTHKDDKAAANGLPAIEFSPAAKALARPKAK